VSKAQQDIRRKTRVLEHAARTGNVRPEVFPYAHTHAALSFTAGSGHVGSPNVGGPQTLPRSSLEV
jgi:hypothetical protein